MKVVKVEDASASAATLHVLLTERRVLTELSEQPHPLLGSALCCFRSARHLHFVMPLLAGGTLARLMSSQPGCVLPEAWVRFYAAQIALALGALHSRRMLYLDLKLENVLLSAKGDATLVDPASCAATLTSPTGRPSSGRVARASTCRPTSSPSPSRDHATGGHWAW